MMRSTPAGKAFANTTGVIVLASMGRRLSQHSVASGGSRRGCRLCIRACLCVVAVWVSGSMSAHVYEATAWLALRTASNHVAMPPQSSTRWMGLWERMNLGMFAWALEEGVSCGRNLEGLGIPVGGVRGEIDAGHTGKGLAGRSAKGVGGSPPLALVFGKNLSCSTDI